jgi:hypothetical protein
MLKELKLSHLLNPGRACAVAIPKDSDGYGIGNAFALVNCPLINTALHKDPNTRNSSTVIY